MVTNRRSLMYHNVYICLLFNWLRAIFATTEVKLTDEGGQNKKDKKRKKLPDDIQRIEIERGTTGTNPNKPKKKPGESA